VTASLSVVVLSMLARRKSTLGRAIPSAALVADSWLSATGVLLAIITVLGTLLTQIGWWWADAVAAFAVAIGAFGMTIYLSRQQARLES
jgi:divalent metal cation (Fe/Co/Zn/Cd) transporter